MQNLVQWFKDNGYTDVKSGMGHLEQELGIKVKEYAEEGLYVFNYSQIDSPKTHPVVIECRGLILTNTFECVCRPFDRFFNYGEAPETTKGFDITRSEIYEKADGSLVKVYHWNGSWRIATRGTAFAESENYTGEKFIDLILRAFGCEDIYEFSDKMDCIAHCNNTYLFEYTSPHNRIVTPYSTDTMVLLGRRSKETGEYPHQLYNLASAMFDCNLNVRAPKTYSFNNEQDMLDLVASLTDLNEGVVAYDPISGVRIKVKSETYVAVHKLRGDSIPTPKRIVNLVVTNETEEYLTYFPEERERFEKYITMWCYLCMEIDRVYQEYKDIEDQKEFALYIKDLPYQGVLFTARKAGKDPISVLNSMDTNKKMKLYFSYVGGEE